MNTEAPPSKKLTILRISIHPPNPRNSLVIGIVPKQHIERQEGILELCHIGRVGVVKIR